MDKISIFEKFEKRDTALDGFWYACVKTTKIYCRISCPANKPKFENVEFVPNTYTAEAKGYRPCLRCKPKSINLEAPEICKTLVAKLAAAPNEIWTDKKLAQIGYNPDVVRRNFKKYYGTSFIKFARGYRLGAAIKSIQNGDKIIEAQIDAGFESAAGFSEAIKAEYFVSPKELAKKPLLFSQFIDTPIGQMIAIATETGLCLLEFMERKALPREIEKLKKRFGAIVFENTKILSETQKQVVEYFEGTRREFSVPLQEIGTPFEKLAWEVLKKVPFGETKSYGQQAEIIGNPNASRAVARANGANMIAIIIPCHRIIGADGSMTGYGGKIWRKEWLLKHENRFIPEQQE